MKVYVGIDGGCSCYEVEVIGVSTSPQQGGEEIDINLADLLGVTSETSIISMIDELITKHQEYAAEAENIIDSLRRDIRGLEVKLSSKAQEARIEASKDEKINNFREALRLADRHTIALQNEIDELKRQLKDSQRGYRFAGFMDKHNQLWTPVAGRYGLFEFRSEKLSAAVLKNNEEYLAVPYHEEVK